MLQVLASCFFWIFWYINDKMNNFLLTVTLCIAITTSYNILNQRTRSIFAPQLSQPTPKPNHLPKSQEMSDTQIVQTVLEGVFAQNNLPGPFMVKYCLTDQIAHELVNQVTDGLSEAVKASLTGLLKLIEETVDFRKSLPDSFIDCLGRSQEIRSLGFKYDIDGSISFQDLGKKVGKYATLHFLEVHKWAIDLNDKWTSQKYYEAAYNAAIYAHIIQNSKP